MWQSSRFRQSELALRQAFQFIANRIYPVASPAPFKRHQFIEPHSMPLRSPSGSAALSHLSLDFDGIGVSLLSMSHARMRKSVFR